MVIIWKVLARYSDERGQSYSELGYYLSRSEAYRQAAGYFARRNTLSQCNKMIIQEISINAEGSYIRNSDYISDQGEEIIPPLHHPHLHCHPNQ